MTPVRKTNARKRSFVMVIFGATGDLAQNKLIPALFSLYSQKKLPGNFSVIGFSRRAMSDKEFREFFREFSARKNWAEFSRHLFYQQGTFEDKSAYKKSD